MLFMKFGKPNHLEQIKKGIIHFRPLRDFINNPTLFRGDQLESKLKMDKTKPFIINGMDISEYIDEATQTYEGYDSILSFSASKLNYANCHELNGDVYTVNDDFVKKMNEFGSHVIIINSAYLINALRSTLDSCKCNYSYKSIVYIDKSNPISVSEYFSMRSTESDYDICFLKDKGIYSTQNEWRFIIHDIEDEFPLVNNGGVNIETGFRTDIPIFEVDQLRTLRISGQLLE